MKKLLTLLAVAFILPLSTSSLNAQEEEYGMASYYHDDFQGRETAYGDTYDKNKFTCAHKKHPYGTMLRVTRIDNKRSVDVKVTDKGPFIKGRIVDLSRAAAEQLGLTRDGTSEVKVKVLSTPSGDTPVASAPKPKPRETKPATTSKETTTERPREYASQPAGEETAERILTETRKTESKPKSSPTKKTSTSKAKEEAPKATVAAAGVYQVNLNPPAKEGYTVQMAVYTNYALAIEKINALKKFGYKDIQLSAEATDDDLPVYRIFVHNFDNVEAAENYVKNLKKKYKEDGKVVDLSSVDMVTAYNPQMGNYLVQVGAFSSYKSVDNRAKELKAKGFKEIFIMPNYGEKTMYHIFIKDFDEEGQAKSYKASLKRKYKIDSLVKKLDELQPVTKA